MNPEIDLYQNSTDQYDKLQQLRPDYMGAKQALLELATKYLKDKKGLIITDFCSGTGANTKMLVGRLSVNKAVLIDINQKFIEIAKKSGINAEIEAFVGDILDVNIDTYGDVVISMFAYHHVPDDKKSDYLEKVKDALKKGSLLLLGEIYMPDKKTTIEYYKRLYNSIPKKSKELEEFLMQTAHSSNFEYKVSKAFADRQLVEAGFELTESKKIWPMDDSFDKDVGTFVEVWRYK